MRHSLLILSLIILLPTFLSHLTAQDNRNFEEYTGDWNFLIKNTPYGDFAGVLRLSEHDGAITGEIILSEEAIIPISVERFKGERLVFSATVDGADSLWSGYFKDNTYTASGEFQGDDFTYTLEATKKDE